MSWDDDATLAYADVFPMLVAACPTWSSSIHALRADPDDGDYLRVRYLVVHLIHLLDRRQTECFPNVFGVIERVLAHGDTEARSLVAFGFLEDLVDPELYLDVTSTPSDFRSWLGPEAGLRLRKD